MQNPAERAAQLLKQTADFLRDSGDTDIPLQTSLYRRAEDYLQHKESLTASGTLPASDLDLLPEDSDGPKDIPQVTPAGPLPSQATAQAPTLQGGWLRRASWIGPSDSLRLIPADDLGSVNAWISFRETELLHQKWKDAVLALDEDQAPQAARPFVLQTEDSTVHFLLPPFLPSVVFAHFVYKEWDAFYSISNAEGLLKARSFDFASPEVHRLNFVTPLQIAGHELAYLRYFLHIVRGDLGAFRLLEEPILTAARQHLLISRRETGGANSLSDAISPPQLSRIGIDGGLIFTAWLLYAGVVFRSTFSVYPNGTVTMIDDAPASEAMPELLEYSIR